MRKYFCKKDKDDERDHLFARPPLKIVLPVELDLRSGCSPVVDQGKLGSCTANAMGSGLREYLEIKNQQVFTALSRLYLYYHQRLLEDTINEDSGATIRDGMKVLKKRGICPEVLCPYDISKFTIAPFQEAEDAVGEYKLGSYQRLNTLNDVKRSIYEGYPVVLGRAVYESFESNNVAKTGIVPVPKDSEQILGGHAMLIVSYSTFPPL